MDNICIIGGSGFIGTHLIRVLGKDKVINLDKNRSLTYSDVSEIADIRKKENIVSRIKNNKWVVLLAAEHRDDVTPSQLYYEVNVEGTKNVLSAMEMQGVNRIIFTSSVAVYGLDKNNPDENHPVEPFNHYGRSKWQAEEVLREWYNRDPINRSLIIIRPTVVFGEENRGNVYNLLAQIKSGKFMMIGNGENKKSMAYVGNIVQFIKYLVDKNVSGYHVFNYADKPDLSTKELVKVIYNKIGKNGNPIRIPFLIGFLLGKVFDFSAFLTGKKLPISSVRIKKFCATTQFSAKKIESIGFKAPFTLEEGLNRTINSIQ